jgi:nicotinamidase-related amidase
MTFGKGVFGVHVDPRFGMELGYHVALVKDATAAFDREGMHAAHEVNGPRFAHAILTPEELLALLPH